jgi:hypothetical protein
MTIQSYVQYDFLGDILWLLQDLEKYCGTRAVPESPFREFLPQLPADHWHIVNQQFDGPTSFVLTSLDFWTMTLLGPTRRHDNQITKARR